MDCWTFQWQYFAFKFYAASVNKILDGWGLEYIIDWIGPHCEGRFSYD